jgi:hypothetical protein
MTLYTHNHRMWAAIGTYGGQEDNTFYRRRNGRLLSSGGKELHDQDVVLLGDDTIHAVHNPLRRYTGAIHVYGGDFVNTPRSARGGRTESRESGIVLSSHQPIGRPVSHLERGSRSPEPTWSTDLSFTRLTEIGDTAFNRGCTAVTSAATSPQRAATVSGSKITKCTHGVWVATCSLSRWRLPC